uniref:Uncharacterized protein n=1 Tax=Arundo donax TaxID=35708 RepID=A0A0A9FIG4_ARUDO
MQQLKMKVEARPRT